MSKPVVFGFLVMVFLLVCQFEWRQRLVGGLEADLDSKEQQSIPIKGNFKEKIILSQEKNIQQLNEFVRSLEQQLLQCRGMKNKVNVT